MISKRKMVALAVSIVAVGGAAVGVVSASAAGPAPDSVSCTFNGSTTQLDAIPAPGPGTVFAPSQTNPTAEEGTAPFVTADQGTYTFAGSTMVCSGVDSNGNVISASSVASNGDYNNIVCGSGNAYGTATLTDQSGAAVATVAYTIVFTSGEGTLRSDVTVASDGVTIDVDGSVSIVPNVGGCVTGPAMSFTVLGSAQGSGAGDADDTKPTVPPSPLPSPSGVISTGPAIENESSQCSANGGQRVLNDASEGVSTFVYTWQPSSGEVDVCVRAQDASTGTGAGGRVAIVPTAPGVQVGGTGPPSTDGSGSACSSTTPNAVPGSHPMASGGVGPVDYAFDTYSNAADVAWVCVQVGSAVDSRVVVPVSVPSADVSPGYDVVWYPDPDTA